MASPILSPSARLDLYHIWENRATSSPKRAEQLIVRFNEVFASLASFPLMGKDQHALRPGLRSFVVKPHVVLYRVRDNSVEIIRIVPASLPPSYWLDDE